MKDGGSPETPKSVASTIQVAKKPEGSPFFIWFIVSAIAWMLIFAIIKALAWITGSTF